MIEAYVEDETFNFLCPLCKYNTRLDLKDTSKRSVKIKCKCGDVVNVNLNYRSKIRRSVDLIANMSFKGSDIAVKLQNMSMCGVCIEIPHSTIQISVGQYFDLQYHLKRLHNVATVTDEIEVMWVVKKDTTILIGGRCLNNVEYTKHDKDKGFYLMQF